jgi:type IV pilus assembly protein PilP
MSGPVFSIGWRPGPAGASRARTTRGLIVLLLVVGPVALAGAQSRPAAGQAPATPAPAAKAAPATPAPQTPPPAYVYDPEGRRDPFIPLMNRGDQRGQGGSARPDGLPGLMVGDVALKGIVLSRGAYLAMIQAPDTKTYIVRSGDRLFDGTVKAVTADAIVFVQQVNDPLSLVKQREVRKPLRPIEEGK